MQAAQTIEPSPCGVEGCSKVAGPSGFCEPHRVAGWKQKDACSESDCDEAAEAKGLCARHYRRDYRNGHTRLTKWQSGRVPFTTRVTKGTKKVLEAGGRIAADRAAELLDELAFAPEYGKDLPFKPAKSARFARVPLSIRLKPETRDALAAQQPSKSGRAREILEAWAAGQKKR